MYICITGDAVIRNAYMSSPPETWSIWQEVEEEGEREHRCRQGYDTYMHILS